MQPRAIKSCDYFIYLFILHLFHLFPDRVVFIIIIMLQNAVL